MTRRIDLYTIGWALVGLLLIAIFGLTSATATDKITGDPFSYDRGGAAGLVELLNGAGYHVDVDSSLNPALRKGDLALAFIGDSKPIITDSEEQNTDKSAGVAQRRVREWRDKGGAILWMPVGEKVEDLQTRSIHSFPGGAAGPRQASFGLVHSQETFEDARDVVKVGSLDGDIPVAHLLRLGEGMAMVPASGEIGLNYAIAKSDNAQIVLRLVRMLAKPGARVVMTTATMAGGAPPSFFEAIGPWALSAWKQLLLFLIVVAVTLGSRFGLPEEERRREQGSRELVDALGGIYERAKAVDTALSATLKRAESRIAKRLKLSGNADLDAHLHLLPEPLVKELTEVRAMVGMKTEILFALKAAARLDRETDAFVGQSPLRHRI